MLRLLFTITLLVAATSVISGKVDNQSCGSAGKVLEVRISDCNNSPCDVIVGKTYKIEVDFEPSTSHEELNFWVTVFAGRLNSDVIKDKVAAAVTSGNAFTLAYPWTVSGDFPGLIALRIQLSGNGVVEICATATVNVLRE